MAYVSEINSFKEFKIGQKIYLNPKYRDPENIKKLYKDIGYGETIHDQIHIDMSKIKWVKIDKFFQKRFAYGKSKFDYGISFKEYQTIDKEDENDSYLNHYYPLDLFQTLEEKINKLIKL